MSSVPPSFYDGMATHGMPVIRDFMVADPRTISEDVPIQMALEKMGEHDIRHLPVTHEGKLRGILSDRDIKLTLAVRPKGREMRAGDVMIAEVYSVLPTEPLDKVLTEMFRNKYGCVVVRNDTGKVIGIFTSIDALKVLTALLREKYVAV